MQSRTNMKHPLKIVIALGGLTVALSMASGEEASLRGSVRDASGAAIAGAITTLSAQNFSATATTDSTGAFVFAGVPDGSGSLTVTATGFADARISWRMTPTSPITIELRPSVANAEVVVSAARAQIALSFSFQWFKHVNLCFHAHSRSDPAETRGRRA